MEYIIRFINSENDNLVQFLEPYYRWTHRMKQFLFWDDKLANNKRDLLFMSKQKEQLVVYAVSYGIHITNEEIDIRLKEKMNDNDFDRKWDKA